MCCFAEGHQLGPAHAQANHVRVMSEPGGCMTVPGEALSPSK